MTQDCYGLHKTSKFLFWAIISVASREEHDAEKRLCDLAPFFESYIGRLVIGGRGNNVQLYDVQALVVLSLWPWLNVYWWTDRSWTLANLAMSMGILIGLHHMHSETEYSHVVPLTSSEIRAERLRTWCACVAVVQK